MKQCRFLKHDDERCKRKIITGKLCWQHSDQKKVSFIIFIAAMIGLLINLSKIYNYCSTFLFSGSDTIENIVCDRDKEMGCNLNFDLNNVSRKVKYTSQNGFPIRSVGFSYGEHKVHYDTPVLPHDSLKIDPVVLGHRIPDYHGKGINIGGPYQVRIVKDKLHFKGKIHDIYNDEMLGWFDGNEFGIIKPCSFSWNKDDNGIEIMDRYGNVCFSVLKLKNTGRIKTPYSFYYRGYYKYKEYYYVFNEKQHRTKDLNEAIQLIKKIDPVFDHFGQKSLGKRTGFMPIY